MKWRSIAQARGPLAILSNALIRLGPRCSDVPIEINAMRSVEEGDVVAVLRRVLHVINNDATYATENTETQPADLTKRSLFRWQMANNVSETMDQIRHILRLSCNVNDIIVDGYPVVIRAQKLHHITEADHCVGEERLALMRSPARAFKDSRFQIPLHDTQRQLEFVDAPPRIISHALIPSAAQCGNRRAGAGRR